MRAHLIAPTVLAALVSLAAGAGSAGTWQDPGAVDEALCAVSHVAEDHSGESARGFVFDGVPFTASDLTGVDFKDASLKGVDDVALTCDQRCADFSVATLDGAQFQQADASCATFLGASAQGASFSLATLKAAEFTGADLSSSIWDGADVGGANLVQADLTAARGRSDEDPTSFAGAQLRGALLYRVDFGSSSPMKRTDFSDADLRQSRADCRYEDVEVEAEDGSTTTETIATECPVFTYADFSGADFRGAVWRGADFGGASFQGAATLFDGALFDEIDLTAGGTAGADFSAAVLAGVSLRDAIFIAESPSTMTLARASFAGAALESADLARAVLCHPLALDDADMDGDVCEEIATTCVDWVSAPSALATPSLERASLLGAWAPGIELPGFTLRDADLRLADLRCADLQGADFGDTLIDGADFGGAAFLPIPEAPPDPEIRASFANAVGACMYPPEVDGVQPDPKCPRFDDAEAEGVSFKSAILDGATFPGASLEGADLSFVQSECAELPVDPDLNGGLSDRRFCIDFTGAALGPDGDDVPASFAGSTLDAPVFESVEADRLDLRDVFTQCRDGQLPGESDGEEEEDPDPVFNRFCPRFENATLTRADFRDAFFDEAEFGCLEHDGVGPPPFDCTDLKGARFAGARLRDSTWRGPVDLGPFDVMNPTDTATDLSNADLSGARITCRAFTFTDGTDEIQAKQRCPVFAGAVLTPGLDLSGAGIFGVDWSDQDLSGIDLSGATLGCFEFKYDDENGVEQSGPRVCTTIARANLSGADLRSVRVFDVSFVDLDLSGADFTGTDLRGYDLSRTNLDGATLADATLGCLESDEDPPPPPDCTILTGATLVDADLTSIEPGDTSFAALDLRGAIFSLVDLRGIDFTGSDLTGATFESAVFDTATLLAGTTLVDADFTSADLGGISLAGFDLRGTIFSLVDLRGIDFTGSDLTGAAFESAVFAPTTLLAGTTLVDADFTLADLGGISLAGFDLRGTIFSLVDLRGIDFTGSDLTGATFESAVFDTATLLAGTTLVDADLTSADLGGISLAGFDLRGAIFSLVDLRGIDFTGSDLTGATFESAVFDTATLLAGTTLVDADLTSIQAGGTSFAGLDLQGAIFSLADLRGVDLSGADLSGADLSGADLSGALLDGALLDAGTRFAASYVPNPSDTDDEKKDNCTLGAGESPTDVTGASLLAVDFRPVVDFGGECIVYDASTTYDENTLGLTDTLKSTMTFVPEPGSVAANAAALVTLALMARRRRRG